MTSERLSGHRRRTGAWVLPAALLLPICLAFVLIHYHRQARDEQQAAVRRATLVYSGVVAWQFARSASNTLHRAGDIAIYQIGRVGGGAVRIRPSDRAGFVFSSDTLRPTSPLLANAHAVFRYDLETGELVGAGPRFRTERAGEIGTRVRTLFADSIHDPHHIRFERRNGSTHATVYGLVRGDNDRVRAVYGIEADPDVFLHMLDSALVSGALLPPALLPAALRRDQVRVTLTTPAADTVFTVGGARGNALTASDTLESERGGLRATVELDSAFAASLVVGDATSPPLRLIALLLALSAVLAVAALVQVRRSRALGAMRSQFVANVSHELRTPLTHISMFAETLMRHPERSSDERFQFAGIIHREARRLTNIVDGVLRFSRLEAGRETIEPVDMDLAAEVREAVEVFRPMLDGARATLVCDVPDDALIRADPSAVRQILVNLLDNAIKYGPRGQTITVRVRRAGSRVMLDVADQSAGIPVEQRARVLEPFTRVTEGNGRKVPGAGLGLSVVRSLTALHGGRVTLGDAPDGGTLVVVDLPASPLSFRPERGIAAVPGERPLSPVRSE